MTEILQVNNLSVCFGNQEEKNQVVTDVSFSLHKGKTLALVGESGSGKSVTAHSIMRLLPYPFASHPSGSIIFQEQDLLQVSEQNIRAVRGNKIGMIFQEPMIALNPLHTILKQIGETLALHQGLRKHQIKDKTLELLHKVKIPEPEKRLNSYPHELSGGQRQRVMIAMAIANRPDILIADEPTTALDATVQKEIMELLQSLQQEYNMAALLITHDLGVVQHFSSDVIVMHKGHIVEQAPTKTLFSSPQQDYTKALLDSKPSGNAVTLSTDDTDHVISSNNLCVSFPMEKPFLRKPTKFLHAVKSVDIDIQKGSTLGIVGESGSGKSTLALALLRLIESSGNITFQNTELNLLSQRNIRPYRKHLQIVFQDPFASLSPRMTITQIIAEGLEIHSSLNKHEIDEKVILTMKDVNLDPDTRHRYPHEFSGGQRQRIAIARAIILEPEVIFLDEPTSALDRAVQIQILDLLKELQIKRKLTYVFISHDLHVVRSISHKVAVMHQGCIIEYGNTDQVLKAPQNKYTKLLLDASLG